MLRNEGRKAYFVLWSPGLVFSPVLGPNFFVYEQIFKIRSFKLVRIVSETDYDIKRYPVVYILAFIDNFIRHIDQFGSYKDMVLVQGRNFTWPLLSPGATFKVMLIQLNYAYAMFYWK